MHHVEKLAKYCVGVSKSYKKPGDPSETKDFVGALHHIDWSQDPYFAACLFVQVKIFLVYKKTYIHHEQEFRCLIPSNRQELFLEVWKLRKENIKEYKKKFPQSVNQPKIVEDLWYELKLFNVW